MSKGQWWSPQSVGTMIGAIALVIGSSSAAIAADTLRLRIGPLQQTLAVDDLENFAETGDIPTKLLPYKSFLSGNMRGFLQKSLNVQPEVATQFLDELWESPTGKIVLDQLQIALPDTSVDGLKTALNAVAGQELNISALNVLRAYPAKELTVDLTAVAGLLLQTNLPNLQSQILSPRITDDLEVEPEEVAIIPSSLDPTAAGEQSVRRQTVVLRDSDRDRTIPVDIYDSPSAKNQLIVLSHGFAANRRFLDYLAYHLASHGYTVVTPDHPGSNVQSLFDSGLNFENLLPADEFIERPKDISFVLDELETLNVSKEYPGQFATTNVTVIGHSFGGFTALALAGGVVDPPAIRNHCNQSNPLMRAPGDWLQCAASELPYGRLNLKDDRIKQAIALNPIIGEVFGTDGLSEIDIPTMVLTGTKDAITPSLTHQLLPFKELGGEKYLVVADGATHMSVTDLSNRDNLLSQSTLVPEVMGAEAEPVREMLKALSLSFVERHDEAGETYGDFLSAGYVQSLSSDAIQLRLTQEISTELEQFLSHLPQTKITAARAQQPSSSDQKQFFFSFWRSPKKPKLQTYPTGILRANLDPFFQTALNVDAADLYSVAHLNDDQSTQQWN
ncbi:protein of unknown function DUF1400 [[Leptolyngbya] sp. PCC 7376]|uniref:alpha/beta hydrolase n=1 Tax=[Leptolyngbya] sp. PCC 7376 TaxID=111781 RepID=UPI00029F4B5E|nr:alpha/beta hydrolase [[Leptolyngbya] sp. PCC 7376]AFY39492.1 protein of unknown function DUF1400 [[Leptolyngbya] sp. PCC 7376]